MTAVKKGTCWQCGCTDGRACPGGCYWLANAAKPTCSNCITPRQAQVLKALHKHETIRRAMASIGAGPALGMDHVRRLESRGYLRTVVRGRWGQRKLTEKGLAAIGLWPCPMCRGHGAMRIVDAKEGRLAPI